jgi:superfamily II DNA or RNA helicase
MDFSSLGLSEALLRAVAEQGYSSPTPIQSQAIPAVLAGRDLLAAAQTGTGKTAAFTLPLLQRLADDTLANDWLGRIPRVLVLVPTRELAAQVSVRIYAGNLPPDLAEKEFAEHGRVRFMNLARDIFSGRCRGFGFIEMEGHEARAASTP